MRRLNRIFRLAFFTLALTLTGCACVDPLEPLNRQIFTFNMILDHAVFRPVARVYDKVVPPVVACRVGNFFDNIDDLTNIANNALQFKLLDAWSDCWRFAFNTTFGLLGLFDVATYAGLPKHHQDFGLTLARYGFVNSTYLMIPVFGPSTIRDSIGWTVDWHYLSIWPYIEPRSLRYGLYGLRLVHKRAGLLAADQLIDEAMDPYVFVRDAYLQKREADIRSICPPGDPSTPASIIEHRETEDTFVSDKGEEVSHASDNSSSNDPFVAEDSKQKQQPTDKATKTVPAPSNDPFVGP